jgi:hypothetical protein
MDTLLLDTLEWDLVLDSAGNIAKAAPPYALAQDVASAVRLFKGELFYNTPAGIPYFSEILGQLPPISLTTGWIERQAMTVPGVFNAQCTIASFANRTITGQVQFTDAAGVANAITF